MTSHMYRCNRLLRYDELAGTADVATESGRKIENKKPTCIENRCRLFLVDVSYICFYIQDNTVVLFAIHQFGYVNSVTSR